MRVCVEGDRGGVRRWGGGDAGQCKVAVCPKFVSQGGVYARTRVDMAMAKLFAVLILAYHNTSDGGYPVGGW